MDRAVILRYPVMDRKPFSYWQASCQKYNMMHTSQIYLKSSSKLPNIQSYGTATISLPPPFICEPIESFLKKVKTSKKVVFPFFENKVLSNSDSLSLSYNIDNAQPLCKNYKIL